MQNEGVQRAIEIAGSQLELSRMIDVCQPNISKYLRGMMTVPIRLALRLEKDKRFRIARELFRPDVFGGQG